VKEKLPQDLIERLRSSTTELGDLMYDRIAEVAEEDLRTELIAQASAAYSWFLMIVDALPQGGRVAAMQIGTQLARCSHDFDNSYSAYFKEMPKA